MCPNPEYSRWISMDQLLMGWMYSSMTSEIVMRVIGTINSLLIIWKLLDRKVDHADLVTQVLVGLDEEYTSIVVQVNSRDQVSWHELSSTLMTFESRLEYLNQVRSNFGSINLTHGNSQNAISYSGRGNRGRKSSNFRAKQEAEGELEGLMK
ncbi:Uncharacterized protein Adt_23310 [Abeliophyllum distichum]|uniref:Uncharacterized protein n=1 Tax=Abeliophyllum distichum TaxID=126358 RepID=A0ABD1SAZ2_9LAMI